MTLRRPLGALVCAAAVFTFAARPASAQEQPAVTSEAVEVRLEARPLSMFNQHLFYGSFARPRGMAFDRERGELWMVDGGSGRVAVFRPDGAELFSFTSKQALRDPQRITLTPEGGVAVIAGDRSHVRLFGYRGQPQGELAFPESTAKRVIGAVAYDAGGNAYLGDNGAAEVLVVAPDGRVKVRFGSRGTDEGQFQSISAIAVFADGTICVVDAQALGVQLFDSQGNFVRGWGRHQMGAENFSLPSGVALDAKERIYVSDELRHQVKIFDRQGKLLGIFGGLGDGPGQLSFPTDVAVDGDGIVYVAERQNARIQTFRIVEVAE